MHLVNFNWTKRNVSVDKSGLHCRLPPKVEAGFTRCVAGHERQSDVIFCNFCEAALGVMDVNVIHDHPRKGYCTTVFKLWQQSLLWLEVKNHAQSQELRHALPVWRGVKASLLQALSEMRKIILPLCRNKCSVQLSRFFVGFRKDAMLIAQKFSKIFK